MIHGYLTLALDGDLDPRAALEAIRPAVLGLVQAVARLNDASYPWDDHSV